MGQGTVSTLGPPPANFPYFSIDFHHYDSIHIVDADVNTIGQIKGVIMQYWPLGIQAEMNDNGVYMIIFNGRPFMRGSNVQESLASKRLCSYLLSSLRYSGWQLLCGTDLSISPMSTWIFKKIPSLINAPPAHIIAVGLSGWDKFQLVNAPNTLFPALKAAVPIACAETIYGYDYEIKMNGNPWQSADLMQGIIARRMLLTIFRNFDLNQWKYLGTANLKGLADTIFFENDTSIVPGQMQFIMLSLNATDRVRLIEAQQPVIDAVRDVISKIWGQGIQEQTFYQNEATYEFKLRGRPWCSRGDEAMGARLLITSILQSLATVGWAVLTALDVTRRANDKAAFVLRNCAPVSMAHFCLSPMHYDKIVAINAPADLVQVIGALIRTLWPFGVQQESIHPYGHEWKLAGVPWVATAGNIAKAKIGIGMSAPNDWAVARHMLLSILNDLNSRGWRFVCSADVSAAYTTERPDGGVHRHGHNIRHHHNTGRHVGIGHGSHSGFNHGRTTSRDSYPVDTHAWWFVYTGTPQTQPAVEASAPPPSYNQAVQS